MDINNYFLLFPVLLPIIAGCTADVYQVRETGVYAVVYTSDTCY